MTQRPQQWVHFNLMQTQHAIIAKEGAQSRFIQRSISLDGGKTSSRDISNKFYLLHHHHIDSKMSQMFGKIWVVDHSIFIVGVNICRKRKFTKIILW